MKRLFEDVSELYALNGYVPSVVVTSAVGLPEPSGLTEEQWTKQTDELLRWLGEDCKP